MQMTVLNPDLILFGNFAFFGSSRGFIFGFVEDPISIDEREYVVNHSLIREFV